MTTPNEPNLETRALDRAKQALRLAAASLPHLAGLTRLARIRPTDQVPVAAVAASGLVLVNTELFADIALGDAAYVLAHELMHLALDTHGREGRADPLIANFAHDYIINDILTDELGREPPLDGLFSQGAREKSFEEWIIDLSQNTNMGNDGRCWGGGGRGERSAYPGAKKPPPPSPMSRALADAGLKQPDPPPPQPSFDDDLARGDLIPPSRESEFEPELAPHQRQQVRNRIRRAAAKAASLSELSKKIGEARDATAATGEADQIDAMVEALRGAYHTPWQLALQKWMDAVAPGERTYARPSRRGADRTDVVLPGRQRHGWTMHIILDTSGSMESYLPAALGAIAQFCEASGVADIHLVQCDTEVTRDEWVDPVGLAEFPISGFGYSDMRPAMHRLETDPEVTAALMLTDGYIDFLNEPPPYHMLWILLGEYDANFNPGYGQVIPLTT